MHGLKALGATVVLLVGCWVMAHLIARFLCRWVLLVPDQWRGGW